MNSLTKAALVRPSPPLRSTEAMAIGVLLKKRVNRTSAARSASAELAAGAAIEDDRPRRAGRAVGGDRNVMEETRRERLAVPLDEVEVDDLVAVAAAFGERAGKERDVVAADDVAEGQRARFEAGDVDAEPFGEGSVEVDDAAVRLGGEEAGRRVIEIVDGVLQLLEDGLLLLPLVGDVGDRPGDMAAAARRRRQRAGADPVPARPAGTARQRPREPDLLLDRPPVAHPLSGAIDRLGCLGVAGKHAVDRLDVVFAGGAGQVGIGAIGIKDAAGRVGDQHAFAEPVEEGPGDVEARAASAEMDDADREAEQARDADDRKDGEEAEHQGLRRLAADEGEPDGDAGEAAGKDDQPPGRTEPRGPVDHRPGANGVVDPFVHSGLLAPCARSAPPRSGQV